MNINQRLQILVFGEQKPHHRYYGHVFSILDYADPVFVRINFGTKISELLAHRPDIVLLHTEWTSAWASAAAQLQSAGVPLLVVMDGVIEWSYLWSSEGNLEEPSQIYKPLISNHLCVIGRHPARILASMGLGERIHVIGLPRVDHVARVRSIDLSKPRKILVATANEYGHELAQKISVRQALKDIKSFFDAHSSIVPVWRIQDELAGELGIDSDFAGPIEDALEGVNGLIAFTSTVLLDGMLRGIPSAQVEYRPVPMFVQSAWEIRNADHIETVVQELLYPPAQKLAYQEFCLRDELELGDASQKLAELIVNIAKNETSNGVDGAGQIFHFGELDYRMVQSQISAFSISSKATLQYELQCAYNCLENERKINAQFQLLRRCLPLRIARRLSGLPGFTRTSELLAQIDNT